MVCGGCVLAGLLLVWGLLLVQVCFLGGDLVVVDLVGCF